MSARGMEGAIDALVTYIGDQGPAKLAALNAEYAITDAAGTGEPITLDDWAAVYTSEHVEGETFPYLEVIGVRAVPSHESADSITQQLSIAILCWIEDQDSNEHLKRRGYRYARALLELLKDSRGNSGLSGYTASKLGPLDFGPLRWNRSRTRVLASIIVGVELNVMEAYP